MTHEECLYSNHSSNNGNKSSLPACIYDVDWNLFRITRSCGKILTAGFGVAYKGHPASTTTATTQTYLFMEEALFLHERGLLQVYCSMKQPIPSSLQYPGFVQKCSCLVSDSMNVKDTEDLILMDTQDLYTLMLEELHFPLSVYITYSHLRSQSYIVVRHFQQRLSILEQQCQKHETLVSNSRKRKIIMKDSSLSDTVEEEEETNGKDEEDESLEESVQQSTFTPSMESLRIQLRQGSFHAPIPTILHPTGGSTKEIDTDDCIAFHVYDPTSTYRKTDPGIPNILVAISYFHEPSWLSFDQIHSLTKACNGINLRIATVSDSGTVIMFGITDVGVPCIDKGKTTLKTLNQFES
jgi:hypothetical protein